MESTYTILHQDHYDRVRNMTLERVNRKLDLKTERYVRAIQSEGPFAIRERLKELDKEWDIDRILMLNFSIIVFAQLWAARKNPKWLFGPLMQTPFLLMHSTLGWSPPMLVLRPLGFRTRKEIHAEREALLSYLKYKT